MDSRTGSSGNTVNDKLKRNIIIMFVGLVFICIVIIGIYFYEYARIDYSAIDYIKTMQRSANRFSDLAGDIGVESADDLGFEVRGKYDLLIHYGRQVIVVNKRCLMSDEWRQRVGAIGIKVYMREDEETGNVQYKVTYWDTEIDQWTLVTH